MIYPDDFINKIIHGDCLEVMKDIPDKSIDMILTSPPYDNLRDYNGYSFDFESIAKELYRIIKVGGVVVWIVNDQTVKGSETGTSFRQALYFKEIGFNLHDTMIYKKNALTFPDINRYYQCFEYMFVFSKEKPKNINLIVDRYNKQANKKITSNSRDIDGSLKEMPGKKNKRNIKEIGVRFNIWEYDVGWKKSYNEEFLRVHPAIFPEKLANDHIISWSNENDIIYDPMCGSGTTCKMALINNRKYIGSDISKEYCELAEKRINQVLTK